MARRTKTMTVGALIKELSKFDARTKVGISVEEGADLEDVLCVEENENGVWICVLPERGSDARRMYDRDSK